ncbi:MAG: glycosyltransferase family 4 protein [Patescibacteria group bacterium]
MKIAFFHELTPLSGARKVVEEYGKILRKNHQVDLFYVDDREDKKIVKIFNKIYFFKFGSRGMFGENWRMRLYRDSIELINLYFLHKKISRIVKSNKYDFIFVNPSKYTQSPFLLKFIDKTVYFCQEPLRMVYDNFLKIPKEINLIKKIYEKLNRKIRKFIDEQNVKKANIVLTNSLFSKKNIERAYNIGVSLCYLGVDAEKFYPVNIKKDYDLLFIGEKVDIEGYDLLRDTLKLYKKPPVTEFVSRTKNGLGINEDVLIKKINRSRVVLSLSRNEPFGLIPIEAMSCEVPVIVINEGGLKESVVDDKTGYLIKMDKNELKNKIDFLLNNAELRNKFGRQGRERVLSKFTWKISVDSFYKILTNYKFLTVKN